MSTTPEVQTLLKTLVDKYDKEDRAVRERQIRTWKRLKLFWEGFHKTWYSEVAHDWRIWDEQSEGDDTNQSSYDKPINVFRAYLESIIAALSITVPPVKCYPDDADSTLDLATAKVGDKIAQLLYRHNDVPLLWLHALFIFMTEGMVGCYSYAKSDEKYGTYEKKKYEDTTEEHQFVRCPSCGHNISEQGPQDPITDKAKEVQDKINPDDDDVPVLDYLDNTDNQELCPSCLQMIDPMLVKENLTITRLIGITQEPKTRICMEAYGGLNIKVPSWARTQSDCPYLFYCYETHYTTAIEMYGDVDGTQLKKSIKSGTGPKDPYEEWGRLSPQYNGEYPEDIVTIRNVWLRPSSFNALSDEDDIAKLKRLYPSGCKVVFVNDQFAEACNSSLDDSWTLTYNPMSDYIHFDPLGVLLVSVQELTNDLISLIIQTIEHGIGQTFADPGVLSFNAYRQLEAVPGGIYEATPKTGKSLADGFYQAKTASLSGEVLPFLNQLQSLGQVVSGALPSLFGGAMAGSETASQYSMSRAQALQRLQNVWKMLTMWWKNIFGKAIPMFIKEVKDDERTVEKNQDGSFINVFIRKAELEGKIGRVELEANENLPITWNQRKDVLMQLVQTSNPEILAILGSPENLPIIREAIGLEGFFVPGEDQRDKTLDDIKNLLNSTPMPNPMTGQETPSIEPDPIFDNTWIGFEIIRKWVISDAGQQSKTENPDGYRNVLLLGQAYKMLMAPPMMAPQGGGSAPAEKPKQDTQTPIKGEGNVQTV